MAKRPFKIIRPESRPELAIRGPKPVCGSLSRTLTSSEISGTSITKFSAKLNVSLLFYDFWIEMMMNEDEEQIKSVLKWTYGKHESTLTLILTESYR